MSLNLPSHHGKHKRTRVFVGIKGRRPDLKAARQKEALQRTQERALRSPKEQVALLDSRLGKDMGAIKERARLGAQ